MAKNVYLLWFLSKKDSDDDALLIGVYETEDDAERAISRLRQMPGFIDAPTGFQIHTRELGQDSWKEGFVRAK